MITGTVVFITINGIPFDTTPLSYADLRAFSDYPARRYPSFPSYPKTPRPRRTRHWLRFYEGPGGLPSYTEARFAPETFDEPPRPKQPIATQSGSGRASRTERSEQRRRKQSRDFARTGRR